MRKLLPASAQHEYSGLSGIKHPLLAISKVYPSKPDNAYLNFPLLASIPTFFCDLMKLKRRLVHNGGASLGCSCKGITEDLQLPPLGIVRHVHSNPEGYRRVTDLRPPDECHWGNSSQHGWAWI